MSRPHCPIIGMGGRYSGGKEVCVSTCPLWMGDKCAFKLIAASLESLAKISAAQYIATTTMQMDKKD